MKTYPHKARGPLIEVPCTIKGRPSYRWVQGWIVHRTAHNSSMPMRYREACEFVKDLQALAKES